MSQIKKVQRLRLREFMNQNENQVFDFPSGKFQDPELVIANQNQFVPFKSERDAMGKLNNPKKSINELQSERKSQSQIRQLKSSESPIRKQINLLSARRQQILSTEFSYAAKSNKSITEPILIQRNKSLSNLMIEVPQIYINELHKSQSTNRLSLVDLDFKEQTLYAGLAIRTPTKFQKKQQYREFYPKLLSQQKSQDSTREKFLSLHIPQDEEYPSPRNGLQRAVSSQRAHTNSVSRTTGRLGVSSREQKDFIPPLGFYSTKNVTQKKQPMFVCMKQTTRSVSQAQIKTKEPKQSRFRDKYDLLMQTKLKEQLRHKVNDKDEDKVDQRCNRYKIVLKNEYQLFNEKTKYQRKQLVFDPSCFVTMGQGMDEMKQKIRLMRHELNSWQDKQIELFKNNY